MEDELVDFEQLCSTEGQLYAVLHGAWDLAEIALLCTTIPPYLSPPARRDFQQAVRQRYRELTCPQAPDGPRW